MNSESVTDILGFAPTDGQQQAIDVFFHFCTDGHENPVMLLRGYAGTGKSSLIAAFIRQRIPGFRQVVMLAPTGRAAKVLSGYTGIRAYTIHRWIYQQGRNADGTFQLRLRNNNYSDTLFVVDEASMIPNSPADETDGLLDDLMSYVFSATGNRLLLVGDVAQLPPVGSALSPALDPDYLQSAYSIRLYQGMLTQVVRQQADSGILSNATRIRESYTHGTALKLSPEIGGDVEIITPYELGEQIEVIASREGIDALIVLCRSNKRANLFNKQIRGVVLQFENELNAGDLLMITRNNYFWAKEIEKIGFIANGDIAEVRKVIRHHNLYGFRFADVELQLQDYPDEPTLEVRIILDSLHADTPSLSHSDQQQLYQQVLEDHAAFGSLTEARRKVRDDPFFNAIQVKYAYAVTCHKAQGGQWPYVVVDYGFVPEGSSDAENHRWLYTAFTRATKKLWMNGFPDSLL
jgi:exodeoxyribonuclease-5